MNTYLRRNSDWSVDIIFDGYNCHHIFISKNGSNSVHDINLSIPIYQCGAPMNIVNAMKFYQKYPDY